MTALNSNRYAIVVSRFNEEVTAGLLKGASNFLKENGIKIGPSDVFYAPGAFEIPLIALKLAKTKRFAGVICLGSVIKGETAHFEFISLGATVGLMQGMLSTETPISFGILTTYTEEQARERSEGGFENKGREAASACYEAVKTLQRIEEFPS